MSTTTFTLPPPLRDYLVSVSVKEHEALRALREETGRLPMSMMQIAPEQGQLLGLLVRLIQARRCLEVGVFTGYSALAVALALPPEGRLIACDVSEEWTAIARRYWEQAGVAQRIDLRLAPALDTLDGLIARGEGGFDFAFIDADKSNYVGYYERCLALLRPGGLIAVDNTLWYGKPADPSVQDPDTVAIRTFNAAVGADARVWSAMLPIGDGMTLILKPGPQPV